MVLHLKNR